MLPRYKAIDNETGVMLRVLSIDLEFDYIIGLPFEEEARDTFGELIIEKRYYFEDIELLQSTGLLDKNGREIFEGHIVSAMSEGYKAIGVVKRRIDGYWLMYPALQNGQSWKLVVNEQGDTDVEIIGNKFEHPHLLGED